VREGRDESLKLMMMMMMMILFLVHFLGFICVVTTLCVSLCSDYTFSTSFSCVVCCFYDMGVSYTLFTFFCRYFILIIIYISLLSSHHFQHEIVHRILSVKMLLHLFFSQVLLIIFLYNECRRSLSSLHESTRKPSFSGVQ